MWFTIVSRRLKFTKILLFPLNPYSFGDGLRTFVVIFSGAKGWGPGMWMSHSVSFFDSCNFGLLMQMLLSSIFFRMVRQDHLIQHWKLDRYQLQTCWKSLSWKKNLSLWHLLKRYSINQHTAYLFVYLNTGFGNLHLNVAKKRLLLTYAEFMYFFRNISSIPIIIFQC